MRKRYSSSDSDDAVIDMTPMLDIVFIMLIFFIVTTSFIKESGIDVNRPSASTATEVRKGNIMIAIAEDGAIWIDRRKVEPGQIRSSVERLKAENPEGSVVIQADTESRSGIVVQVMDQVRLAGVNNISIAAIRK